MNISTPAKLQPLLAYIANHGPIENDRDQWAAPELRQRYRDKRLPVPHFSTTTVRVGITMGLLKTSAKDNLGKWHRVTLTEKGLKELPAKLRLRKKRKARQEK